MKSVLLFYILNLTFVFSAGAKDSPEAMLKAVAQHCQASSGCACFASRIEEFHLTFGNGEILKISPELKTDFVQGKFKSLSEAKNDFDKFMDFYQITALKPYCRNYSIPGPGISGFLQSLEYHYLDELFYGQLQNNGGFCNEFQKCSCEFSMGGLEMSPDFLNNFVIEVSGEQANVYTGGSSAGPIRGDNFEPVYVTDLKSILHQPKARQNDFVEKSLVPLGQFRKVCQDFEVVLSQGRSSLESLIQELEQP